MNLHLSTDSATYAEGQPIQLVLVLENTGPEAVTLQFMNAQRYDFEIRDAADEVVWRWSDGMGFAQMLGSEVLQPGDVRRYEEVFSGRLPIGTYTVVGTVTAREPTLVGRTDILVR